MDVKQELENMQKKDIEYCSIKNKILTYVKRIIEKYKVDYWKIRIFEITRVYIVLREPVTKEEINNICKDLNGKLSYVERHSGNAYCMIDYNNKQTPEG